MSAAGAIEYPSLTQALCPSGDGPPDHLEVQLRDTQGIREEALEPCCGSVGDLALIENRQRINWPQSRLRDAGFTATWNFQHTSAPVTQEAAGSSRRSSRGFALDDAH